MLIVQGLVFAVIYYFLFRFLIRKFNIMTPGREEGSPEDDEEGDDSISSAEETKENRFAVLGEKIYGGIGGKENMRTNDKCTTRIRNEVEDLDKVEHDQSQSR